MTTADDIIFAPNKNTVAIYQRKNGVIGPYEIDIKTKVPYGITANKFATWSEHQEYVIDIDHDGHSKMREIEQAILANLPDDYQLYPMNPKTRINLTREKGTGKFTSFFYNQDRTGIQVNEENITSILKPNDYVRMMIICKDYKLNPKTKKAYVNLYLRSCKKEPTPKQQILILE